MEISFQVDKHEVHPNDTIRCTVQIVVKKKAKIKRIVALFLGEFLSIYHGSKHTHINRNVFVKLEQPLWFPADEKSGIFEPGAYEYKAEFIVPSGLMPSFPPASMEGAKFPGRLQYFVKVVATKVIGFEDERFEKISLISEDFASTTSERRRSGIAYASTTRPMVSLILDRSTYKPGGTIGCQIVVDKKDANYRIQDVVLSLRNKAWGWVDKSWHVEDVFRDEYSLGAMDVPSKSFMLLIPIDAYPTLYGGNVKVTWDVHLHVKLALAKDVHVTVPVAVISSGAGLPVEDMGINIASDMTFCPACGTALDAGSRTCALCGGTPDEP